MRIALFSGNYNYLREGANQALNRLVGYLEAEGGHQVRVYSPVTDTPAFEPVGTLIPVSSVRLPVRGEFQLALGLPRAIRADLARFAPDLIHVATPDLLCSRAQSFAIAAGVPVVASLHTLFETYLDYYRIGWARPVVEAHLRRFYRRAAHVVAPTPALVADLKAIRGDDRVSVWSRGVDRSLFHPGRRDMAWRRSLDIAEEELVLLFFGRLVLEKGVTIFVKTVRELQRRGLRVRPLVVGDGPAAALFDPLPGLIATGHLQDGELARAIASADVMLMPSTTEAFGNVVLEAMASGLPVVSADAPAARALIVQEVTGLFCAPHDVACYAEAVAQLIAAPVLRATMGEAAVAASAAYSWDAASASVEDAYRAILRGRLAPTRATPLPS